MLNKNKQLHIFNPQLVSGSGDPLRDALGLSIKVSDNGEITLPIYDGTPPTGTLLKSYEFDTLNLDVGEELDYQFNRVIRIIGDELNLQDDKQWQAYMNGGTFSDQEYAGIYTEGLFLDHKSDQNNPYTIVEAKQNNTIDTSAPDIISLQPSFRSFYSSYNMYTTELNNTRQIPNIYEFLSQQADKTAKQIKEELNFNIPNGSSDTTFVSDELQQNVFVCSSRVYEDIQELNEKTHLVPTCNLFELRFDKSGDLMESIESNNFGNRFTKLLKDSFLEQDQAPSLEMVDFSILTKELDSNGEAANSSALLSLKVLDVYDMLRYSLQDYNTEIKDFRYLIDDSEEANSEYDDKSTRRLEKSIPTLNQIRFVGDFIRQPSYATSLIERPLNTDSKYNETVAYRLEKIGGPVTGDASTQNTIQNFWFLNLKDVEEFQFYDNQVLYGEQYSYNVYKYVFVAGAQYTYTDLVLSRTIADLDADNIASSSGWCLEMYNPDTGESTAPLFESQQISDLGNTFASEAQINSINKYVADVAVNIRPSLKIVEIPMFTKSLSILDAPTNGVGVKPFYYLDNSLKIGFTNRYLEYLPERFPTALNSDEQAYANDFMSAYDLLEGEEIPFDSTSMPTELQVFRLQQRPNSLQDFDQNLIASVSLKMLNEEAFFGDKTVVDKVVPNTNYYYLFRIVNELGSPAHSSQVLEAKLTDDGGYKFATFDVIFENELGENIFSNPTKKFKKLFNIIPNVKNLILDDSDVDYSQKASEQIENVNFGDRNSDLVWDRKYKLRITSRKTGKKLDINLTFKMNR